MKRRIRQFVLGSVLLAGAGGCASPYQSVATDVNPAQWSRTAEIRLENADTVTLRDATLFLRYDEHFKEDTLTVHIATITPDSLRFEECFLAAIPRTEGPAALKREALIPYRIRLRLDRRGEYRCLVTPSRSVRGVEAVGIRLEKSN